MILNCYLIVSKIGGMRVVKRPPTEQLYEHEIIVPLTLNIDDEWFTHRTPVVTADLPAPDVRTPMIAVGDVAAGEKTVAIPAAGDDYDH